MRIVASISGERASDVRSSSRLGHGVERVGELGAQILAAGRLAVRRSSRIEAQREQRSEQPAIARVAGERGLDVLLAEREADLAQVARVAAQHLDLAAASPASSISRLKPSTSTRPSNSAAKAAAPRRARRRRAPRRSAPRRRRRTASTVPSPRPKSNGRSSSARRPRWSSSGSMSASGMDVAAVDAEAPAAVCTLHQLGRQVTGPCRQGVDVDEVERRDRPGR